MKALPLPRPSGPSAIQYEGTVPPFTGPHHNQNHSRHHHHHQSDLEAACVCVCVCLERVRGGRVVIMIIPCLVPLY